MNLLVFTLGVFLITNDKKYISVKKAVLNPSFISTCVAIPLYLLQFHFPSAIGNAVSMLGKVSTPICMLVLGMRLASMEFKKTFTRPIIYVICVLKLVVFPLFAYGCVYFLPFVDETFKICVFVLSAVPTASVVLTLAEIHECERKMCASVVSITTLLSVITIPLMMLIVTEGCFLYKKGGCLPTRYDNDLCGCKAAEWSITMKILILGGTGAMEKPW